MIPDERKDGELTRCVCSCCGAPPARVIRSWEFRHRVHRGRCQKHLNSNPCVVPGCKRTRSSTWPSETNFLCGDHWRMFCPPYSAIRRTYRRFWRVAKKANDGDMEKPWPEALERRYWRFWFALVKRARAERGPAIDEAEINEMFGWSA